MKGTRPGGARKRPEVSYDKVVELFTYRDDGNLIWKSRKEENRHDRRRNSMFAGKVAGHVHKKIGYIVVKIDGYTELLHRMIFLLHNGYLPPVVDHIDGDIYNNKAENLRAATQHENAMNAKLRGDTTSGVKGVSWHTRDQVWEVWLNIKGYQKYFGRFTSVEKAEEVVRLEREKRHGEFANHG